MLVTPLATVAVSPALPEVIIRRARTPLCRRSSRKNTINPFAVSLTRSPAPRRTIVSRYRPRPSSKQSLTLTQPFLIIQCFFDPQHNFTIQLNLRDKLSQRHRLFLSSNFHNVLLHPLHAQLPTDFVKRGIWLNLTFDLPLLLSQTTKQTFHSVESMTINPTCRIRKVFTVRHCPVDTTDDSEVLGWTNPHAQQTDAIPKQHDFPVTVPHRTQIVSVDKMTAYERAVHKRGKPMAPSINGDGRYDCVINKSTV